MGKFSPLIHVVDGRRFQETTNIFRVRSSTVFLSFSTVLHIDSQCDRDNNNSFWSAFVFVLFYFIIIEKYIDRLAVNDQWRSFK